jgi:YggT family protein
MGTVFLLNFVRFLLVAFEIAIIGRVLLSYVEPRGRSSLGQFVVMITEPVLGPVRRLLPSGGMLDFSPLLVLLVIGAVLRSLQ